MSADTASFLHPPSLTRLALSSLLVVLCHGARADGPVVLDDVTVTAESLPDMSVGSTGDTGSTYQVDNAGIELWGSPGGSNLYRAVSGMPSVNAQSADAYGLVNLPGGTKGLRVRGELATHGSVGSVDGIPLGTVNPGPGYLWLFDVEDLSAVTLQQGPVTPDQTNLFTTSGALDSRLRWPDSRPGVQVSQAFGSSNFTRTFARLDSGGLTGGGRAFISASHTAAEKWRGPGDAPGRRDNGALALYQPLGDSVDVKLMAGINDMKADNYRALTYAQATELGTYRDYDYSPVSSTTPSEAVNYYGYNRQTFKDRVLLSEITWKVSSDSRLTIKPFYMDEKGYYLDGQASGKVRQWLIDHEWYGFVTEYQTRVADTGLKVGYWWDSTEPPGPPTAWKLYTPTAAGDLSGDVRWAILAKVTDRHLFNSAYAMADHRFGKLKLVGGVRYLRETLPGIDAYDTSGIGDVSYDQALKQSSGVVASRSVDDFSVDSWLPYLALSYSLTPAVDLKASAGRNYGAPVFDVWPVYQMNAAKFEASGITANDLWRTLKPETSDAVDAGLRIGLRQAWLEPTLYFARFRNKKVSYDSDGAGPLPAYSQNVGETRAWGAQLAGGWTPADNLNLFGGLSWNRNEFTSDLPVAGGGDLAVKGSQIPDVPRWQANLGVTWRAGAFGATPVVRYTGSRYGDTEHTQRISDYTTVDMVLDYQTRVSAARVDASLSVLNLFDTNYIGVIRADYYQLLSGGSAIYYPGAPRTVVAKLSVSF